MSLGDKHASAIDQKGRLFTWGTGYFGETGFEGRITLLEPTWVQNQEIKALKKVICHGQATALVDSNHSPFEVATPSHLGLTHFVFD